MARNTEEVLIGTGTLYVAPLGTAFPVNPSTAPNVAFVDIGYSEDGWALTVERDTEDVEVAEEIDPLDVLATRRESHLVGAAAQASIENLKIALGGGTIATDAGPPATKTYTPTGTDTLTRFAVLMRGKAPSVAGVAKVRDVWMPVGIPVGAVEMKYQKAPNKTILGVDFRIVKTTGQELFTVKDLT